MTLTTKQRLILSDSIDDVDGFIKDMTRPDRPEFNLLEFVEFKTGKLKTKYGITDEEMTLDFLTNINVENDKGKAERVKNEYKGLRSSAYPSLTEQADMAYWDRQNGTTTLDDAITAVKEAYPKPVA